MSGGGGGGSSRPLGPTRTPNPPSGSADGTGTAGGAGTVGGDGPGVGGGGAGGGSDPCAIRETTVLNSPNRSVVSTLRVGDVLEVVVPTGNVVRLVARTSGGAIAGSITSGAMNQIIRCIQVGRTYEARVQSVSGGQVRVEVAST